MLFKIKPEKGHSLTYCPTNQRRKSFTSPFLKGSKVINQNRNGYINAKTYIY